MIRPCRTHRRNKQNDTVLSNNTSDFFLVILKVKERKKERKKGRKEERLLNNSGMTGGNKLTNWKICTFVHHTWTKHCKFCFFFCF